MVEVIALADIAVKYYEIKRFVTRFKSRAKLLATKVRDIDEVLTHIDVEAKNRLEETPTTEVLNYMIDKTVKLLPFDSKTKSQILALELICDQLEALIL